MAKLTALEEAIAKAREDLLNEIEIADVTDVIDKPTLDTKLDENKMATIESCDTNISSAQTSFDSTLSAS